MPFTDFANLDPSKAAKSVTFAPIGLMVAFTVLAYVLLASAPLKIDEAGVLLAAWAVQRFLTRRARADERFQHKMMHETLLMPTLVTSTELNFEVPVMPHVPPDHIAAAPAGSCSTVDGTHLSEITDFVVPFPVLDREPCFTHPRRLSRGGV